MQLLQQVKRCRKEDKVNVTPSERTYVVLNPEDTEMHREVVQLKESLRCPLVSVLQTTVLCTFDQRRVVASSLLYSGCFLDDMTQNNNHQELKRLGKGGKE